MSGLAGTSSDVTIDITQRNIITVCLMVATLMQALDSTIANVALPYMQGSVSASYDQITWVLTSYVIAAAIFTAPVGWLAARFGRKNLFITCLVGFTITSMMCGAATSLTELVLDRFLQGMFGAALVPLSQSTMLDIYTVEQRGTAMSIWGMGVMVGPIIGPALGGYLTAMYNWRYVFFVNLPIGIGGVLGLIFFLPESDGHRSLRFDWTGFAILSVGLAALQIMLDRGEELDWFSSPVVIASCILTLLGLYLFVVHVMTARNSFIPRAAFLDLNFNMALITMFSVGITLLASSALMAPYLENLGNYSVATAGYIMAPRGFGTMGAMLLAGRITNRVDPRWLMFTGYVLLAISTYMLEGWTPAVAKPYMIETVIIQGAGLGFIFLPLQVVAFYTLSASLRTQGSALLSLFRNVGSAVGISVTAAVLDHQTQYEHAVLSQYVTPFARPLQAGGSVSQALNPATKSGASLLNAMINTQSQIIGYVDDYRLLLICTIPAVLCLFLMRRPPGAVGTSDPAHAVLD